MVTINQLEKLVKEGKWTKKVVESSPGRRSLDELREKGKQALFMGSVIGVPLVALYDFFVFADWVDGGHHMGEHFLMRNAMSYGAGLVAGNMFAFMGGAYDMPICGDIKNANQKIIYKQKREFKTDKCIFLEKHIFYAKDGKFVFNKEGKEIEVDPSIVNHDFNDDNSLNEYIGSGFKDAY